MKPQDIDTIVRLLREEASGISSKDYARIMIKADCRCWCSNIVVRSQQGERTRWGWKS